MQRPGFAAKLGLPPSVRPPQKKGRGFEIKSPSGNSVWLKLTNLGMVCGFAVAILIELHRQQQKDSFKLVQIAKLKVLLLLLLLPPLESGQVVALQFEKNGENSITTPKPQVAPQLPSQFHAFPSCPGMAFCPENQFGSPV